MKPLALVVAVAALLHPAPAGAQLAVLDVGTAEPATLARGTADGWTSVRWTGDGSALIAVAIEPEGLAIRRYPAGGGRARLVRRLPDAIDAVLNRDGTLVGALYDHGLRGTGGVIVRDVASGRARARLPQSAEGDELYEAGLQLAWSRDGARVAYTAYERRGETLRIANARTGRVLRRVDAGQISSVSPEAFSPAGDRLVYTTGSNGRLTVLDIASGATRRLGMTGLDAAWAPAGERIAAGSTDGAAVSGEDQRFGPTVATAEPVDGLSWSPDGASVALRLQGFDFRAESALAVLAPGGEPRILLPYSDRRGLGWFEWSSDGRRLAYAFWPHEGRLRR